MGCGGLWRAVAACGGLWRPVAACGGLWRPVAGCGGLWRSVKGLKLMTLNRKNINSNHTAIASRLAQIR